MTAKKLKLRVSLLKLCIKVTKGFRVFLLSRLIHLGIKCLCYTSQSSNLYNLCFTIDKVLSKTGISGV